MAFQFFDPRGRVSLGQYRTFLLWYFLLYLPSTLILYAALLILGYRGPEGIFRVQGVVFVAVLSFLFFIVMIWPITSMTVRRLHDLGYRARDVLFMTDKHQSQRIGRGVFLEKGDEYTTPHGKNPGKYE